MANNKLCTECGFELSSTAKFCEKCGLEVMNKEEIKAEIERLTQEQEDRDLLRRSLEYEKDLEKRK